MIQIKVYKINVQQRFLMFLIASVIYVVFFYLYEHEISPSNNYAGLVFHQLSLSELFISVFFYLFPLFFLPVLLKRPSDICLWILYLFSYAPTAIMAFHISNKDITVTLLFLFLMLGALLIVKYSRYHSVNVYSRKMLNLKYFQNLIILIFFVLITVFSLNLIAFKFDLNLHTIYERRMFARVMDKGIYTGYILSIGRSLFTICGVYLALAKKKRIYIIFVIVFALAVFSHDGTKSALLLPDFLSLIFYIYSRSKYLYWVPVLVATLVILALLEFKVFKTNMLSEFFTRRIIAVPGYLNTAYWEFFSVNDKVLLTDSIGRYFLDPVYDRAPTFLIGIEILDNVDLNANTGVWMGAYAHFGAVGIFIISGMAGFILGFIDNLTRRHYFMLGTLVCTYLGVNWAEQMFHTSMLTGGVFYIMVFLIFLRCFKIIDPEQIQSLRRHVVYG